MSAAAGIAGGLRSALRGNRGAVHVASSAAALLARQRVRLGSHGDGNRLQIGRLSVVSGLRVDVRGEDNLIVVGERTRLHGVTVTIRGDGNRIEIGDEVRFSGRSDLWVEDEGSLLRIGDRCTLEPGCVLAALEGQPLVLGRDCMLAGEVEIRTGDSHAIFDLATPDEPFNGGRPVTLGDHVWVGKRSFILKGTEIADGVIVGAASVVTRSITDPHSVVAGNPARPVRQGVGWAR